MSLLNEIAAAKQAGISQHILIDKYEIATRETQAATVAAMATALNKKPELFQQMTGRELLFVKYYVETRFNAVEACRLAGISRADVNTLLCKRSVNHAINALLTEYGAQVPEVIARLTAQARASVGDFLDENGRIDIELVRKYGSSVVESVEYADDGSGKPIKIKLASQAKALEALAKVHALFTERVQVDVSGNVQIEENKKVMAVAMADPALLAKLGELAEAVRDKRKALDRGADKAQD